SNCSDSLTLASSLSTMEINSWNSQHIHYQDPYVSLQEIVVSDTEEEDDRVKVRNPIWQNS
ncbi:23389_t:CDS:2, partial [Racocetra persica]